MDLDLDTGRLVVFVAGFVFFLSLEHFAFAHHQTQSKIFRLAIHGFMAGINTVIVRILTFVPMLAWLVYVEQQGWGIARWIGFTGWLEFVLSIIVLDAFDYFWHRANHRVPPPRPLAPSLDPVGCGRRPPARAASTTSCSAMASTSRSMTMAVGSTSTRTSPFVRPPRARRPPARPTATTARLASTPLA